MPAVSNTSNIAFNKYIDITSVVAAGTVVNQQELIGRYFTTNNLLPTNSFIEFTTAAQVGAYFGTTSEEYARALFYFSFINKTFNSPDKISFARWADGAVAPMIFGLNISATPLATFQAISDGAISLTLGGITNIITGLDFTAITSFANIATILQGAINSETGIQWTAATVTYNALSGGFNFVGGDAVVANVSAQLAGTGTEILNLIGWGVGAIFSYGSLAQTITQVLTESTAASNNFGSFAFLPVLDLAQVTEAATWNSQQDVMFQYSIPVTLTNAATWQAALSAIGGCELTIQQVGEFHEQCPMMILAATYYAGTNTVQNYMFYQFPGLTPTVTDTTTSDTLDAIGVNYYGRTQTAGTLLAFYQRGTMQGPVTSPLTMNTYANEQWFKGAVSAQIMQLLLNVSKVPANAQGVSQLLVVIQNVINQGLNNGMISVGKTLSPTQISVITNITGDPNAYFQVQNQGYWIDCVIVPQGLQYIAQYTFIYSKDDVINKVIGTDILI